MRRPGGLPVLPPSPQVQPSSPGGYASSGALEQVQPTAQSPHACPAGPLSTHLGSLSLWCWGLAKVLCMLGRALALRHTPPVTRQVRQERQSRLLRSARGAAVLRTRRVQAWPRSCCFSRPHLHSCDIREGDRATQKPTFYLEAEAGGLLSLRPAWTTRQPHLRQTCVLLKCGRSAKHTPLPGEAGEATVPSQHRHRAPASWGSQHCCEQQAHRLGGGPSE